MGVYRRFFIYLRIEIDDKASRMKTNFLGGIL